MFTIIAAVDYNNLIGVDNEIPWYIPEDLAHFKEVTSGNTIIMGYNTWESIGAKPLPNRKNVILTRKPLKIRGVDVIHSVEEALKYKDAYIIGGGAVYKTFMPLADRIILTVVNHAVDTTGGHDYVYFPQIPEDFEVVDKETKESKTGISFTIFTYERKEKVGDRFYMQQQNKANSSKPKRRLKKDIVADIQEVLAVELPSLEKMTVKDLELLFGAISNE